MKLSKFVLITTSAATFAFLLSCSGDGAGVDISGHPDGWSESTAAQAENNSNSSGEASASDSLFAILQAEVFNPICTQCHAGKTAPLGLDFSAGESGKIIGRPSIEIPGMDIVEPGLPEQSYIIWKLEGRTKIVGLQMPLGLSALSEAKIQLFRDWIQSLSREST